MVEGWETVENASPWVAELLDFWFALEPEQWWSADPALDRVIGERFGVLWQEQRTRPADRFLDSAALALAAVILFDQVPRNIFRGTAGAFATDPLALEIATEAVERGHDAGLGKDQRLFLYMPFEHSEDPGDQQRGLALFALLDDPRAMASAVKHHALIARFGRFPSRNAVPGRRSTPEEIAAGDPGPA